VLICYLKAGNVFALQSLTFRRQKLARLSRHSLATAKFMFRSHISISFARGLLLVSAAFCCDSSSHTICQQLAECSLDSTAPHAVLIIKINFASHVCRRRSIYTACARPNFSNHISFAKVFIIVTPDVRAAFNSFYDSVSIRKITALQEKNFVSDFSKASFKTRTDLQLLKLDLC
jgi:hypothetical protein